MRLTLTRNQARRDRLVIMSAIEPADLANHTDDTPGVTLPAPVALIVTLIVSGGLWFALFEVVALFLR